MDLGGGRLTVNQTGDTTYHGRIIGGGTFEKSGPGKLILNPIDNNSISDGIFASDYSQLVVSGGTLEFSSFGSMPTLPTDLPGGSLYAQQRRHAAVDRTYHADHHAIDLYEP